MRIDKLGNNFTCLETTGLIVWFSYATPIAFRYHGRLTVRRNQWRSTTGRHLNAVDGGHKEAKLRRIDGQLFEHALAMADGGIARTLGAALVRAVDDTESESDAALFVAAQASAFRELARMVRVARGTGALEPECAT